MESSKSSPKPLLIVSDSPSCSSGLGRITRDLATRIHANLPDVFRVGCAGYGAPGNRNFGFPEYHLTAIQGWILPELPQIVENFAGDEECIILFCWDASRLEWFSIPELCPDPNLKAWLQSAKIRKWIYPAVDAEGPNGKLSFRLQRTLQGFERVLNYSKFSAKITGYPDWLPHGIDTSVFRPHDRKQAREAFVASGFTSLQSDDFLVGIVATNQARKDWALGVQACRKILDRGFPVKAWCHTDMIMREWDISLLLHDYGLTDRSCLSTATFYDETMATFYSACNVTLGIGNGEGFGLPLAESLACGVPVVHGRYGGGADFVPDELLVKASSWRYEGPYCLKRAVHNPDLWAATSLSSTVGKYALPAYLDWNNLWPGWENWLRKGIN